MLLALCGCFVDNIILSSLVKTVLFGLDMVMGLVVYILLIFLN